MCIFKTVFYWLSDASSQALAVSAKPSQMSSTGTNVTSLLSRILYPGTPSLGKGGWGGGGTRVCRPRTTWEDVTVVCVLLPWTVIMIVSSCIIAVDRAKRIRCPFLPEWLPRGFRRRGVLAHHLGEEICRPTAARAGREVETRMNTRTHERALWDGL